ncbi:MAG: hypothetical protein C0397_12230 [Odoribacter sp.]|nr:hypothetical protein [Odoribacter sp.]
MKRICFFLPIALFFLISVTTVFSQDTTPPSGDNVSAKKHKFWYGPKVGMDLATPTLDQNDIKAQLKSNYQVGFFFQFGRKIYLQPEIYYSVVKENGIYSGSLIPEDVTVTFAKVPVLLGIKLIDIGIVSAHVMAGPMGTFLLSESNTNPLMIRPKKDYKLQLGGGVDVFGFITLDVRYAVDLDDNMNEELGQLTWKSGVNVTLGLKLR